jgi:large subunit ribosomal protein L30
MTYAAIRIRGHVNVNPKIKKTLTLLNLTKANHCVLLPENKCMKGMLQVAKDYITWGEISNETIAQLLEKRGKGPGDSPLTEDFLQSVSSYKTFQTLAKDIAEEKIHLTDIPEVKPVFRLHPPLKGYEGIKRSFINKGALGYRAKEINTLINRML